MKKILMILSTIAILTGCAYDELPPMTDDITTNYVLPIGEEPTAEEMESVLASIAEYEESIKK